MPGYLIGLREGKSAPYIFSLTSTSHLGYYNPLNDKIYRYNPGQVFSVICAKTPQDDN